MLAPTVSVSAQWARLWKSFAAVEEVKDIIAEKTAKGPQLLFIDKVNDILLMFLCRR